jgi:septal ring factor EnvC (AmiA/AmiB activator)
MALFNRDLKRLRKRHNELMSELWQLSTKERQLSERLRYVNLRRAELEDDRAEVEDGD